MRFVKMKTALFIAFWSITTVAYAAPEVATPVPPPSAEDLQKQRIERAAKHLDEAQRDRNAAADRLSQMRQLVRSQTGLLEVTPENVRQVISKLQEQHEQLELDGAGAAGRRRGLDEALAEVSTKLKARAAAADPVADELAKVVEARQNQLDRVTNLSAQAVVSKETLDNAKESLAAARAELAAARQKGAGNAAAEVLDFWNRQRLELTISEQERQAKLDFINKRLEAFSKALDSVDGLEEQRSRVEQADRELSRARDEMENSKRMGELRLYYESTKERGAEETPKRR